MGMARSGTSMTAGLLHALGVDMSPATAASPLCPKGSFEDVDWIVITQSRDKWDKKFFRERVQTEVRNRQGKPLWGFKSAETHHCLMQLLPDLPDPHLVFVRRNIQTNAKSYQIHAAKRFGKAVKWDDAVSMVANSLRVLQEVESVTAHLPQMTVLYESLKSDSVGQIARLAEFIGVELTTDQMMAAQDLILRDHSTIEMFGNEIKW